MADAQWTWASEIFVLHSPAFSALCLAVAVAAGFRRWRHAVAAAVVAGSVTLIPISGLPNLLALLESSAATRAAVPLAITTAAVTLGLSLFVPLVTRQEIKQQG